MHEESELGVCAHWTYKDGGASDSSYDAKMDWLRQVLQWHDELGGTERLSTLLQHSVSEERIFVSTPKGHVLDLTAGATALDFAYRVHTDVGHACKSVKVDGNPVMLATPLLTGQQVEVLTRDKVRPERIWLEPSLGLITTHRARAKILSYFRSVSHPLQGEIGEACLRRSVATLGLDGQFGDSDALIVAMAHSRGEQLQQMYRQVGSGEVSYIDMIAGFLMQNPQSEPSFPGLATILIEGNNREGLLHDIPEVIKAKHIPMTGTTGRVSHVPTQAIITVDLVLTDRLQCLTLLSWIGLVEGVANVRRT